MMVDAQIGYTFPKGSPLADAGILPQVQKLTNSPYRTGLCLNASGASTANGGSYVETYEEYGRQWMLGFNDRF